MRRHKEEQSLYCQLSEAMDCLEHICTHGCTHVRPSSDDMEVGSNKSSSSCPKYATCLGLQLLFKHFATCQKRSGCDGGGCTRCKRMWQLLRLHSSICDQTEACRVPLCRQMKQQQHTPRWRLLVRKVVSAKAMSNLSSQTKRKRLHQMMDSNSSIYSASTNPRLPTLSSISN